MFLADFVGIAVGYLTMHFENLLVIVNSSQATNPTIAT